MKIGMPSKARRCGFSPPAFRGRLDDRPLRLCRRRCSVPDQGGAECGYARGGRRRMGRTTSYDVSDPGSRLWVEIDTAAGVVRSAPMWIDHEAELRIGRPELNVQAKLSGNEGPISSDGLIDIFTLVVEHYNSPVPWAGTGARKKAVSAIEYNLDDVFSDGIRSASLRAGGERRLPRDGRMDPDERLLQGWWEPAFPPRILMIRLTARMGVRPS